MLNTKTRLQESLQIYVNCNVRKALCFVWETLFLHFETVHKVSLRSVMTAGSRCKAAQYGCLHMGFVLFWWVFFVWFLFIFSDITFVWRVRWIRFERNFGNDLCTKCSWALLNWQSNARAVRARLLVDTDVNTVIVSKALKVPSPGLQDKSDDPPSVEDESFDHEADVSPNAWPQFWGW